MWWQYALLDLHVYTLSFLTVVLALLFCLSPTCHIISIIAASGRNGAGLRGMVDDGNLCLIIARVFGNFGGASLYQISEAIAWLVDQDARIINMSVGAETSFDALKDAVDYAEQHGVLFVASAGYVSYVFVHT
jgi:subtilisin family serine protease